MASIPAADLAGLLVETGRAHHDAYGATDGVDPEWASWYAAYLQASLGDRLGRSITRSELTYLLLLGERRQAETGDPAPWSEYYAQIILDA